MDGAGTYSSRAQHQRPRVGMDWPIHIYARRFILATSVSGTEIPPRRGHYHDPQRARSGGPFV